MALDPVPAHLMRLERLVEPLPQFGVLDRLLVRSTPAVFLPAENPSRDALPDILAVGIEIDDAGFFQRFQRRNRRHQFHPVVGGVNLESGELLFDVAEPQDRAPAARTGITRAGAVGMDDDMGRRTQSAVPEASTPYSRIEDTLWWKRSLRAYSSGSFGRTKAPFGTLRKSTSRVSKKRSADP